MSKDIEKNKICAGELMQNATVEDVLPVKHGKWIEYQIPHYFKCSECKCTVPYVKAVLIDDKRKYNYCPACGAKMDKEN